MSVIQRTITLQVPSGISPIRFPGGLAATRIIHSMSIRPFNADGSIYNSALVIDFFTGDGSNNATHFYILDKTFVGSNEFFIINSKKNGQYYLGVAGENVAQNAYVDIPSVTILNPLDQPFINIYSANLPSTPSPDHSILIITYSEFSINRIPSNLGTNFGYIALNNMTIPNFSTTTPYILQFPIRILSLRYRYINQTIGSQTTGGSLYLLINGVKYRTLYYYNPSSFTLYNSTVELIYINQNLVLSKDCQISVFNSGDFADPVYCSLYITYTTEI